MTTCAKDLFAEQGFKGFVRGLSTPATLATPVTSLAFTGKTLARIVLFPGEIERKKYGQVSTCAAFGGLLATLVSCPGERIKCVLQVNSHIKRPRDALFFLTKTYGFAGLYKGWTFTALRDVPGYTAFFLSYRYLRYIYIIFANLKITEGRIGRKNRFHSIYLRCWRNMWLSLLDSWFSWRRAQI